MEVPLYVAYAESEAIPTEYTLLPGAQMSVQEP